MEDLDKQRQTLNIIRRDISGTGGLTWNNINKQTITSSQLSHQQPTKSKHNVNINKHWHFSRDDSHNPVLTVAISMVDRSSLENITICVELDRELLSSQTERDTETVLAGGTGLGTPETRVQHSHWSRSILRLSSDWLISLLHHKDKAPC